MITACSRLPRVAAAAALCVGLVIGLVGCTSDPRRHPPTIGGGVNVEIGANDAVKARNLVVITRDGETGFLDGALSGPEADELTSVLGQPLDAGNNPSGAQLSFDGGPQPVKPNQLTLLAADAPFTVTGDITAGLLMRITLTFANAGATTLDVPIIDGNNVDYRDATPRPSEVPAPPPSEDGPDPTSDGPTTDPDESTADPDESTADPTSEPSPS